MSQDLRYLAARYLLGQVSCDEMLAIGHAAVDSGDVTEATVELISHDVKLRDDQAIQAAFARYLAERGAPLADITTSVGILARPIADGIASGAIPPLDGVADLASLHLSYERYLEAGPVRDFVLNCRRIYSSVEDIVEPEDAVMAVVAQWRAVAV